MATLNLAANAVGDEGAEALALAIAANTTLRTLDLQRNDIHCAGAAALAESLKARSCSCLPLIPRLPRHL